MQDFDQELFEFLWEYITDNRKQKFEEVLNFRTRYLTVVLEDIFQPHNASAVLRSCDLTGVQDVHIIENNYEYEINPDVVVGSSKWLNIFKYNEKKNNTLDTFDTLRAKQYRIVATTPNQNGYTPENIPLDKPIALVLGTEKVGLSEIALKNADDFIQIPMFGFTESFNISVSAALLMYIITNRLRGNDSIAWQLSNNEKQELLLEWTRKTIKRVDVLEKEFNNRRNVKF